MASPDLRADFHHYFTKRFFSWLTLFGNSELQRVDTQTPTSINGREGVCICLKAAHPCRGSLSSFCHSEGIEVTAAWGFVNRDSFLSNSWPAFREVIWEAYKRGGGWQIREGKKSKESQNRALQEAMITMRKKRINSHLQCINGC